MDRIPRFPGTLNRHAARPALAATAACLAACGVSDRAELVGRYEARTERGTQAWTLEGDGTCRIERSPATGANSSAPCEWTFAEHDGRRVLRVTVTVAAPGHPGESSHRTVYVLTPSRFPGGRVSIPLGPREGWVLRKVE